MQDDQVHELWREAAARLAQEPDSEGREQTRESYVRAAVRALEEPELGGYVTDDLSEMTRPADRVERHYIKRAFKRLYKRGELAKVAPVEGGMIYRLA